MSSPEGYIREIKSLRKEIKRMNDHLKALRDQKKIAEDRLYRYMKKNDIEKLDGVTIKSIKSQNEKIPRKKKSEKKRDAIELFKEIGAADPERFWIDFQATQRYQKNEECTEISSNNTHSKKDYDPYLGFCKSIYFLTVVFEC